MYLDFPGRLLWKQGYILYRWYLRMRKPCVNNLSNVHWGLEWVTSWPGLLALRPDNGISPNSFSLPFPVGHAQCIVAQRSLLSLLLMIVQITESWTSSLWLYLSILAVRTCFSGHISPWTRSLVSLSRSRCVPLNHRELNEPLPRRIGTIFVMKLASYNLAPGEHGHSCLSPWKHVSFQCFQIPTLIPAGQHFTLVSLVNLKYYM